MKRLLFLLAFSVSLFAQTATTPVLIPVFYNGGGVLGSQWYTRVHVNNFTSQAIDGRGVEFLTTCPIPEGCFAGTLEPGAVGAVTGPVSHRGLLLHVPASEAENVEIGAAFGEASRHRAGVQLPIVRERDFRTTPLAMPIVAMQGSFGTGIRTTLRIYSIDPDASVRVELHPWYAQSYVIDQRTIALPAPAVDREPAFAQLNLQMEFPAAAASNGAIRLRVIPLANGEVTPRVWAFVTVTEDATNEVTVVTAQ